MKLYIAGPMRGYPAFNFPAFDKAAETLAYLGIETISPADHDRSNGFNADGMTGHEDLTATGFDLKSALAWDLDQVAHADGVAVLDGWEKSSGARAEVATAHAVGVPVATVANWCASPEARTYITATTPRSDNKGGEVRTTSATGGEKGTKPERYDLIPVEALAQVARLYARGAEKYAAHNWRRGYEWSKSYAAMQRHATQFWAGEDIDPEMQLPHMASVAFHALALLTFMDEQPAFDDRYKPSNTADPATTHDPETSPAEPPSRAAQDGLRVGARVRVRDTCDFRTGEEGEIVSKASSGKFDWDVHLDGYMLPGEFQASELEVIA
jgi:hypothetical protein